MKPFAKRIEDENENENEPMDELSAHPRSSRMKLRQNGTVFLMIKTAALAAGGRAEQRTAEYRISNRRMSKGGIALLSLF